MVRIRAFGVELPAWVDVWGQRYVDPGPYFFRPTPTLLRQDLATWRRIWLFLATTGTGGAVAPARPTPGPEFSPYQRIATPIIGCTSRGARGPRRPCAGRPGVRFVRRPDFVASPGVEVLEGPSSVQKFGYDAAHVRFTVTERCPGDPAFSGPSMLWRAFETRDEIDVEDDTPVPDGDIYTSRATSSTSGSST